MTWCRKQDAIRDHGATLKSRASCDLNSPFFFCVSLFHAFFPSFLPSSLFSLSMTLSSPPFPHLPPSHSSSSQPSLTYPEPSLLPFLPYSFFPSLTSSTAYPSSSSSINLTLTPALFLPIFSCLCLRLRILHHFSFLLHFTISITFTHPFHFTLLHPTSLYLTFLPHPTTLYLTLPYVLVPKLTLPYFTWQYLDTLHPLHFRLYPGHHPHAPNATPWNVLEAHTAHRQQIAHTQHIHSTHSSLVSIRCNFKLNRFRLNQCKSEKINVNRIKSMQIASNQCKW